MLQHIVALNCYTLNIINSIERFMIIVPSENHVYSSGLRASGLYGSADALITGGRGGGVRLQNRPSTERLHPIDRL